MLKRGKLKIRLLALFLSVSFLVSDLSFAAPEIHLSSGVSMKPIDVICQDLSRFEAPVNFSNLQEYRAGDKDKPLIIHIQDAHSNYSGQQNLASTLDYLMDKYSVTTILVEGSSIDSTLTPLRKIIPNEECRRAAKSLLIEGQIAGEEYLNLTSGRDMRILGIEDQELYFQSLRSYGDLADQRDAVFGYLRKVRAALAKLKSRHYPAALLDYERSSGEATANDTGRIKKLLERCAEQGVDLKKFPNLLKMKKLGEREGRIDFARANLEQAQILEELTKLTGNSDFADELQKMNQSRNTKASQFSYFQNILNIAREKNLSMDPYLNLIQYGEYLKEFSEIELDKLLDEIVLAENVIYSSLLKEEDAKMIRSIDRYFALLDTAYNIQMTSQEFRIFRANEPDFSTAACLAFINRKLAEDSYFHDLIPLTGTLEEGKKALIHFYDSVSLRDEAFVWNAKRFLSGRKEKAVVLISGGYHTRHLKQLLQAEGYGYAVLTPIVTRETNRANYEKLLLSPIRKNIAKVEVTQDRTVSKPLSALGRNLIKKNDDGIKFLELAERIKSDGLTGVAVSRLSVLADPEKVREVIAGFRNETRNPAYPGAKIGGVEKGLLASSKSAARLALEAKLEAYGIAISDGIPLFSSVPENAGWVMDKIRSEEKAPIKTDLKSMPVADIKTDSDNLILFSREGLNSVGVYIGIAKVGGSDMPVIYKAFASALGIDDELILAQIQDRLGIGPRFYGVVKNADGEVTGYAMQLSIGDSVSTFYADPATPLYADFMTITKRLVSAGIMVGTGFVQTRSGALIKIDAGNSRIAFRDMYEAYLQKMNAGARLAAGSIVRTMQAGDPEKELVDALLALSKAFPRYIPKTQITLAGKVYEMSPYGDTGTKAQAYTISKYPGLVFKIFHRSENWAKEAAQSEKIAERVKAQLESVGIDGIDLIKMPYFAPTAYLGDKEAERGGIVVQRNLGEVDVTRDELNLLRSNVEKTYGLGTIDISFKNSRNVSGEALLFDLDVFKSNELEAKTGGARMASQEWPGSLIPEGVPNREKVIAHYAKMPGIIDGFNADLKRSIANIKAMGFETSITELDKRDLRSVEAKLGRKDIVQTIVESARKMGATEENPLRVLDAGAGKGVFLADVYDQLPAPYQKLVHLTGIEPVAVEAPYSENIKSRGIEWHQGFFEYQNLSDYGGKGFHLIYGTEVLQYAYDPKLFLDRAREFLADHGQAVVGNSTNAVLIGDYDDVSGRVFINKGEPYVGNVVNGAKLAQARRDQGARLTSDETQNKADEVVAALRLQAETGEKTESISIESLAVAESAARKLQVLYPSAVFRTTFFYPMRDGRVFIDAFSDDSAFAWTPFGDISEMIRQVDSMHDFMETDPGAVWRLDALSKSLTETSWHEGLDSFVADLSRFAPIVPVSYRMGWNRIGSQADFEIHFMPPEAGNEGARLAGGMKQLSPVTLDTALRALVYAAFSALGLAIAEYFIKGQFLTSISQTAIMTAISVLLTYAPSISFTAKSDPRHAAVLARRHKTFDLGSAGTQKIIEDRRKLLQDMGPQIKAALIANLAKEGIALQESDILAIYFGGSVLNRASDSSYIPSDIDIVFVLKQNILHAFDLKQSVSITLPNGTVHVIETMDAIAVGEKVLEGTTPQNFFGYGFYEWVLSTRRLAVTKILQGERVEGLYLKAHPVKAYLMYGLVMANFFVEMILRAALTIIPSYFVRRSVGSHLRQKLNSRAVSFWGYFAFFVLETFSGRLFVGIFAPSKLSAAKNVSNPQSAAEEPGQQRPNSGARLAGNTSQIIKDNAAIFKQRIVEIFGPEIRDVWTAGSVYVTFNFDGKITSVSENSPETTNALTTFRIGGVTKDAPAGRPGVNGNGTASWLPDGFKAGPDSVPAESFERFEFCVNQTFLAVNREAFFHGAVPVSREDILKHNTGIVLSGLRRYPGAQRYYVLADRGGRILDAGTSYGINDLKTIFDGTLDDLVRVEITTLPEGGFQYGASSFVWPQDMNKSGALPYTKPAQKLFSSSEPIRNVSVEADWVNEKRTAGLLIMNSLAQAYELFKSNPRGARLAEKYPVGQEFAAEGKNAKEIPGAASVFAGQPAGARLASAASQKRVDSMRTFIKSYEDKNIAAVLIYGSAARGNAGENSDLDYILILKEDAGRAETEATLDNFSKNLPAAKSAGFKFHMLGGTSIKLNSPDSMRKNIRELLLPASLTGLKAGVADVNKSFIDAWTVVAKDADTEKEIIRLIDEGIAQEQSVLVVGARLAIPHDVDPQPLADRSIGGALKVETPDGLVDYYKNQSGTMLVDSETAIQGDFSMRIVTVMEEPPKNNEAASLPSIGGVAVKAKTQQKVGMPRHLLQIYGPDKKWKYIDTVPVEVDTMIAFRRGRVIWERLEPDEVLTARYTAAQTEYAQRMHLPVDIPVNHVYVDADDDGRGLRRVYIDLGDGKQSLSRVFVSYTEPDTQTEVTVLLPKEYVPGSMSRRYRTNLPIEIAAAEGVRQEPRRVAIEVDQETYEERENDPARPERGVKYHDPVSGQGPFRYFILFPDANQNDAFGLSLQNSDQCVVHNFGSKNRIDIHKNLTQPSAPRAGENQFETSAGFMSASGIADEWSRILAEGGEVSPPLGQRILIPMEIDQPFEVTFRGQTEYFKVAPDPARENLNAFYRWDEESASWEDPRVRVLGIDLPVNGMSGMSVAESYIMMITDAGFEIRSYIQGLKIRVLPENEARDRGFMGARLAVQAQPKTPRETVISDIKNKLVDGSRLAKTVAVQPMSVNGLKIDLFLGENKDVKTDAVVIEGRLNEKKGNAGETYGEVVSGSTVKELFIDYDSRKGFEDRGYDLKPTTGSASLGTLYSASKTNSAPGPLIMVAVTRDGYTLDDKALGQTVTQALLTADQAGLKSIALPYFRDVSFRSYIGSMMHAVKAVAESGRLKNLTSVLFYSDRRGADREFNETVEDMINRDLFQASSDFIDLADKKDAAVMGSAERNETFLDLIGRLKTKYSAVADLIGTPRFYRAGSSSRATVLRKAGPEVLDILFTNDDELALSREGREKAIEKQWPNIQSEKPAAYADRLIGMVRQKVRPELYRVWSQIQDLKTRHVQMLPVDQINVIRWELDDSLRLLAQAEQVLNDYPGTELTFYNGQKKTHQTLLDELAEARKTVLSYLQEIAVYQPIVDETMAARKLVSWRELVRYSEGKNAQHEPPALNDYWRNQADTRKFLLTVIQLFDRGESPDLEALLKEAHRRAAVGADAQNPRPYYKRKDGSFVEPGVFREGGGWSSRYIDPVAGIYEAAQEAGIQDPYFDYARDLNGVHVVQLSRVSNEARPRNVGTMHFYPEAVHFAAYFRAMTDILREIAALRKASPDSPELIFKIAEFYQYAANARPFDQINNSLFMNFANALLRSLGLRGISHGVLDHAAMRLQPANFAALFYRAVAEANSENSSFDRINLKTRIKLAAEQASPAVESADDAAAVFILTPDAVRIFANELADAVAAGLPSSEIELLKKLLAAVKKAAGQKGLETRAIDAAVAIEEARTFGELNEALVRFGGFTDAELRTLQGKIERLRQNADAEAAVRASDKNKLEGILEAAGIPKENGLRAKVALLLNQEVAGRKPKEPEKKETSGGVSTPKGRTPEVSRVEVPRSGTIAARLAGQGTKNADRFQSVRLTASSLENLGQARQDGQSMMLLAAAYAAQPKELIGKYLSFRFSQTSRNAIVRFVEAGGKVSAEFYTRSGYAASPRRMMGRVEIDADMLGAAKAVLSQAGPSAAAQLAAPLARRTAQDMDQILADDIFRSIRASLQTARRVSADTGSAAIVYDSALDIDLRMQIPPNFDAAKKEIYIKWHVKWVEAIQSMFKGEGRVSIQFASPGESFRQIAGAAVINSGVLDKNLLAAAQGHGISAVAEGTMEESAATFIQRTVFAILVQRLNRPTESLKNLWANLRSDPMTELDPQSFSALKTVGAAATVPAYAKLSVKVIRIAWDKVVSTARMALAAVGSAA